MHPNIHLRARLHLRRVADVAPHGHLRSAPQRQTEPWSHESRGNKLASLVCVPVRAARAQGTESVGKISPGSGNLEANGSLGTATSAGSRVETHLMPMQEALSCFPRELSLTPASA